MSVNEADFIVEFSNEERKTPCTAYAPGEVCPACGKGRMDYDGTLILTCPECGFQAPGGGFT